MKKETVFRLLRAGFLLAATVLFLQTCGGCLPERVSVNATSDSGSIAIEIRNIPRPASGSNYVGIAMTGSLTGGGSGTGRTSFSDSKTFEVTPATINPAPSETKTAMKPGNWQVTVSSGSWSATGNGIVPAGGARTFVFTYDSAAVSVR